MFSEHTYITSILALDLQIDRNERKNNSDTEKEGRKKEIKKYR